MSDRQLHAFSPTREALIGALEEIESKALDGEIGAGMALGVLSAVVDAQPGCTMEDIAGALLDPPVTVMVMKLKTLAYELAVSRRAHDETVAMLDATVGEVERVEAERDEYKSTLARERGIAANEVQALAYELRKNAELRQANADLYETVEGLIDGPVGSREHLERAQQLLQRIPADLVSWPPAEKSPVTASFDTGHAIVLDPCEIIKGETLVCGASVQGDYPDISPWICIIALTLETGLVCPEHGERQPPIKKELND